MWRKVPKRWRFSNTFRGTALPCEEAAEGAHREKITKFEIVLVILYWSFFIIRHGKKHYLFVFWHFFMFISLQASELCSLDSIGFIPLKLFTPHNINHRCIIHINVPSTTISKKIFWLHYEKLITDKWTRPY